MPATPQMNNVPPNKFSPFGGAINKSLLTPCRRVGLSRKRKTPNSILKLNSEDSASNISSPLSSDSTPVITKNDRRRSKSNLDSLVDENESLSKDENCSMSSSLSLKSTPVNNKNITNKRKSRMKFDSPMKETVVKLVVQNSEETATISNSERKTKKSLSLVKSVDNSSILKEVKNEQKLVPTELKSENNEFDKDVFATSIITEDKYEKAILQSENIPLVPVGDDESSSCDSLVLPKSKKSKVLYDSDEDFLPSNRNKPKLKRIKSETPVVKKSGIKLISKMNSENMVDNLKNCKITLHKLSEDEIVTMESRQHSKRNVNDSSDDEIVAKVKKKKVVVISDDDDFVTNQKTVIHVIDDFAKDSKNHEVKTESQTVCVKEENSLSKRASFIDILEDEEDAFTSTPDKDKNEKKDLIEKISSLERQNKEKRKLLDNLKQASVYQSIHNIKDLHELTVKYREGCVNGLKELLSQLQAHSPINMNTLLNNLHIPSEMITRLCISDES